MRKKHAKRTNADELVANKAKPRHKKATKAEKRLAIRQSDYEKMMVGLKNPPIGAFHRPGSNNK